jgi:NAD(P)-dependent dehydrogenase (short-subunit alcohol dehydrogenase family)
MHNGALSGQTVVVVGGTAGIGLSIARAASEAGGRVVVAARDANRFPALQAELKSARFFEADASNVASLNRLFEAVGEVDHVAMTVHEIATVVGADRRMEAIDLNSAQRFFDAKFWNQYRIARACIPYMRACGSIVFTSGVASRAIIPNHTVISATNGAIESCARQLAREIAPIRVNVVAPGIAKTSAYDGMPPEERQSFLDRVARALPVGRVGTPDEVAQGYLFAMECGYMTGAILDVSGGLLVSGF